MMNFKLLRIVIVLAALLITLVACNNKNIVGTWAVESGALKYQDFNEFTFNNNGSFYMVANGNMSEGAYKVEGKDIIMSFENGGMQRFSFSIVDDSMLLSYIGGDGSENGSVLKKIK